MNLANLLTAKRIACGAQVASKKRALELVSQLLADVHEAPSQTEIFDSLLARERLGTTGLGYGVALPHGRLAAVPRARGALVKLAHGIDYDAIDKQPVDLLFALVVPKEATEEHLQILAQLAEMLHDPRLRERLRHASNADELQNALSDWTPYDTAS